MSDDKPEVITISSKGQVTIPSRMRDQYDLEAGDRLMVVPTDYGIVLKKIELPSIEEFQDRVDDRDVDLSLDEVVDLVHEERGVQ